MNITEDTESTLSCSAAERLRALTHSRCLLIIRSRSSLILRYLSSDSGLWPAESSASMSGLSQPFKPFLRSVWRKQDTLSCLSKCHKKKINPSFDLRLIISNLFQASLFSKVNIILTCGLRVRHNEDVEELQTSLTKRGNGTSVNGTSKV